MISFAFIDSNGVPTGGGRLRELPEGAVPLPDTLSSADLSRLRYRGGQWEERAAAADAAAAPLPTAEEVAAWQAAMLDRARAASIVRINTATDAFRRQFYTAIAGQDALYLEKRAEAVAYIRQTDQAGEPETLDDFPLLANEVGITAPTPWQLAQIWLHLSEAFKAIGAATERPRQIAMNAIAAAPDETALPSIEATFTQALDALLPKEPEHALPVLDSRA